MYGFIGEIMEDIRSKNLFQGLIYLIGGIILLLYTFGFIEKGVNLILIVVALVTIAYGLLKSGLYDLVKDQIDRRKR
jgi:VIT1/CCC1 family predicted Fe2+/Mn2+ transporter